MAPILKSSFGRGGREPKCFLPAHRFYFVTVRVFGLSSPRPQTVHLHGLAAAAGKLDMDSSSVIGDAARYGPSRLNVTPHFGHRASKSSLAMRTRYGFAHSHISSRRREH